MTGFAVDRLVLTPPDIDLSRSPLTGIDAETYVLGVFNPGLTRLPNGNLLMMARVAQALREPSVDGCVRSLRWTPAGCVLDTWPLAAVDLSDPRSFTIRDQAWPIMALTSLSWLLPVELTPDGLGVVAVDYGRAIAPVANYQCYGIEDPRISRVGDRWYMTTCSVSPERHGTALYTSDDGRDWQLKGLVLDHQNKDMLIFEGLVDGRFLAQTRPLGGGWFAWPPDSEWRGGPSINLAASPDALHWKPDDRPFLRPRADTPASARMGGGTPPLLTPDGWLTLWHGVEPDGGIGIYRTYWALLDRDDPAVVRHRSDPAPLLSPAPDLTRPIDALMYLDNVVFTTGMVDAGDHYIVASGEADLACRITHIPKSAFAF